jgi:hypothetical protein
MKQIKLSENQDKAIQSLIKEMLDTNTTTPSTNTAGNLSISLRGGDEEAPLNQNMSNTMRAVSQTPGANNLVQNGASMGVEGTVNGKKVEANFQQNNESILISKKQLEEAKLIKLKENSEVIKIKKFFK